MSARTRRLTLRDDLGEANLAQVGHLVTRSAAHVDIEPLGATDTPS